MTKSVVSNQSLREVFGQHLVQLAEQGQMFYVLDADVAGGTGAHHFRAWAQENDPTRFIQCGISEQAMMGIAAGLALANENKVPIIVTGFASFLLRGLEIAMLSIGYNNANVKIFSSHVGTDVGPDGASAQCLIDGLWRTIPGFRMYSPADSVEMRQITDYALSEPGPMYIRTGRGAWGDCLPEGYEFKPGRMQNVFNNSAGVILSSTAIFATGVQVGRAIEAAKELERHNVNVSVVNVSSFNDFIASMFWVAYSTTKRLVFATEDHAPSGGLADFVRGRLPGVEVIPICVNGWGQSGESDELAEHYEISSGAIVKRVLKVLNV